MFCYSYVKQQNGGKEIEMKVRKGHCPFHSQLRVMHEKIPVFSLSMFHQRVTQEKDDSVNIEYLTVPEAIYSNNHCLKLGQRFANKLV